MAPRNDGTIENVLIYDAQIFFKTISSPPPIVSAMSSSLHWIAAIGLIAVAALPSDGAASETAPLRTVREIRNLSRDEVRAHPAVALRGVITYSEAHWYLTFFRDDTGGIYLGTTTATHFTPGDRVEVRGIAAAGLTATIVTGATDTLPEIQLLGHGPLPPAKEVAPEHLGDEANDAEWIAVRGNIRGIERINDRARLDLDVNGTSFEALLGGYPDGRDLPTFLTGIPVILRGVLGAFDNHRGGVARTALYVPTLEQCEPDPAFLEEKFREPPKAYSELFIQPRPPERIHLQGQITLARPGHGFFMHVRENGYYSGSLWVQTSQPLGFRAGQLLDVAGRIESANRKPVLRDAIARIIRQETPPAPRAVAPEELIRGDYDGSLVSLEGTLLSAQEGLEEDSLIVLAGQTAVCARLAMPSGSSHAARYPRGSRLRLTGICVAPEQPSPGANSLPFAFQIWMRDANDISLLALPPWWTVRRMLFALAITAGIAAAAFLWIAALRRRVAAQTEVIRDHLEKQTLQAERVRIAREFHDTFEQHLVGLGLTLEAAEAEADDPNLVRELLREAAEMTRHTREEARHAIWELRTGALASADVASLIREQLSGSAQAARLRLQVEVEGSPHPLSAVIQNHLLRIAQESFTNALKHARAECVTIRLGFSPREISLRVVDNGAGFDPETVAEHESGRYGLAGMRERALRMKGVFAIASAPGRGTEVKVCIPDPLPCP